MTTTAAQKRTLRTAAKRRRDGMAATADIGAALANEFGAAFELPTALVVSGYYPIGSEANVMPLLEALRHAGHSIALPIVAGADRPLDFRRWDAETPLKPGPFDIPQPTEEAPAVRPDLILAPLLAFDRCGNRLGYGGGFYDRTIRTIREHQPVMCVGVAYAAQEVPGVPHDATDTPLDRILTEDGVIVPKRKTA